MLSRRCGKTPSPGSRMLWEAAGSGDVDLSCVLLPGSKGIHVNQELCSNSDVSISELSAEVTWEKARPAMLT